MNELFSFVRKEFLHVFRDRKTLLILFGLPVIEILIFGFALTNEVKHAAVVIVDDANDVYSRALIERIDESTIFDVVPGTAGRDALQESFATGTANIALIIPATFASDITHGGSGTLQIIADATEPNRGTTLTTYLTAIIGDMQADLARDRNTPLRIRTTAQFLYNPQLEGAPNFVPGVMALVLMLVCVLMTSISIVREKEHGTMEVLLVSPFHPLMVIVAKVIPYLILSLVNLTSILLLSVYVLDLPVRGSLGLLYLASTMFIVTSLALGVLISTIARTQQVAMLVSMLGMLLPTMLFSGFIFPIENMPVMLRFISNLIPAKWYYNIIKAVMIKGLGFDAIIREFTILAVMSTVLTVASVLRFRVRLS